MPAIQVQTVLDRVRDTHLGLSERYRGLSNSVGDETLKLLYADVAGRERRFAEVVDEFERAAGGDVLTTWLQFVPEDVMLARDTAAIGEADSLVEAIERIQQVDRGLRAAYSEMADETECGHLRDLFRNLAELKDNHDRHLSKVLLAD